MKLLTFLNNMIHVLLKSNENKESCAGLNIPFFLVKEATILDIHEALLRHKALIKYA